MENRIKGSSGSEWLLEIVRDQKAGMARGAYSVCSAHPWVLRAAMRQARHDGSPVLIESTSNQVNQLGGYTNMRPLEFVELVRSVARTEGLGEDRVVLGGDHLGPLPFRTEPAALAMDEARALIRCVARAGYDKIHLDASMALAGEEAPLRPELVAERCADLAQAAEKEYPPDRRPVYVIGTEVPAAGGSDEVLTGVHVTSVADLEQTIDLTREAFARRGLSEAWGRVIAVVVQPGVEFGDHCVIEYDRLAAAGLSRRLHGYAGLVSEAHSTDYQSPVRLAELVEDGFAILKVGPALTFALREALMLLGTIEAELRRRTNSEGTSLASILERAMLDDPRYVRSYYSGGQAEGSFQRFFSLFDRIRYYWGRPEVVARVSAMLEFLRETSIPMPLLSQYFPVQYRKVRCGALSPDPEELIVDRVQEVLADYALACKSASPPRCAKAC
jgi:D-tagatose-1,6-bisphosphate aldolase subunit GatZ/KbaZ